MSRDTISPSIYVLDSVHCQRGKGRDRSCLNLNGRAAGRDSPDRQVTVIYFCPPNGESYSAESPVILIAPFMHVLASKQYLPLSKLV